MAKQKMVAVEVELRNGRTKTVRVSRKTYDAITKNVLTVLKPQVLNGKRTRRISFGEYKKKVHAAVAYSFGTRFLRALLNQPPAGRLADGTFVV
jgi:hypothetical protein